MQLYEQIAETERKRKYYRMTKADWKLSAAQIQARKTYSGVRRQMLKGGGRIAVM